MSKLKKINSHQKLTAVKISSNHNQIKIAQSSELSLNLIDPANWPSIINDNFRNQNGTNWPIQIFKYANKNVLAKQRTKFNKLLY